MKSPCLQIANAILQTHSADMAELINRSVGKNGIYSLRANLHAREKKAITSNTIAGLSMITAIAWQLGENELATFHQLNAATQQFRESGVIPQFFNEEVLTCRGN
ncbi:hypothetical protein ACHZIB_004060 [Yersinia enterocolitica]|uniref:hypothetical protein n=1 Tax=Yersinia TaxID=629 RepID=UPI0005E8378E|nr:MULTISPECIES: hypothetical protein [Yersinia]EKN3970544.1 hypothetical protein [Yersinia enterocolitica]EKN4802690.1 hypothetical protein [Yersinia enterocolitica]EKN4845871.1 hypothetical protein [Yersinia enterocolitica]EKN5117694.1 hypothetical protein [Yersinia enterocolitica]ELI8151719.1 hypothetical protein [Yersinia enterocolitica]